MTERETDPLLEWNRLEREITEDAIVSSMFEAMSKANEPLEKFTTWLLIGTAAIASFIITNADKFLPIVEQNGFRACGALLCLSCIFGLLSKISALFHKIQTEIGTAVRKTFFEHLSKYQDKEKEIQVHAEFRKINLQTGIRIERILEEFHAPQPKLVVWFATRRLKKYQNNPQASFIIPLRSMRYQSLFTFLQAVSFLGFLIAGFIYIAINQSSILTTHKKVATSDHPTKVAQLHVSEKAKS